MKFFKRIGNILFFIPFYIHELIHSNLRVANDVITPEDLSSPCLINIDVAELTPLQIVLLSNLITFTPGSICAEFNDDHKHLWVHLMYQDEEASLRDKLQRRYFPFVKGVTL